MGLESFVDEQAIAALNRPTGEAEGLPGAAYSDAFYALEQTVLFPKIWAAVAVGAQLPEPGELLPNLPAKADGVTFIANIFPTAILTIEGDHVQQLLMQPLDWDRTQLVFNYYYPPDTLADPAYEESRSLMRETWERVIEQDGAFVKQVHANAAQRDGTGTAARFSPYWENAVQYFQQMVVETILSDPNPGDSHAA